jgi:hypothetical protein
MTTINPNSKPCNNKKKLHTRDQNPGKEKHNTIAG